jgi:molybdate transport system substrate-binding protein
VRRSLAGILAAFGAAGALLAGCGGDDSRPVVLAASSVRAPLDAAPAARASFSSSGTIATQLRQGAPADVAVLADAGLARDLAGEGLIDTPVAIARNAVAVLVPKGNPRGIRSASDLERAGVRVAIGAQGVPVGDYARTALHRAGADGALGHVVTEEPDAAGVVGKVALGEVDAGLGYASDLRGGRVDGFVLPAAVQPDVVYSAAIVRSARHPDAARAYLAWLAGPDGRRAFTEAGFLSP